VCLLRLYTTVNFGKPVRMGRGQTGRNENRGREVQRKMYTKKRAQRNEEDARFRGRNKDTYRFLLIKAERREKTR